MIRKAISLALALLWALCAGAEAATERCAVCHPEEVKGYFETGMGRSMSRSFEQPPGSFRHEYSGSEFTIRAGEEGMWHKVARDGLAAERRVDWVIGSGNAAFGYLVQRGRHLFQSPVSFYTKRSVWDVAPGYEDNRDPEFDRPITAECLWCHSGRPLPVEGAVNQFEEKVFAEQAISCDRCHGPVDEHLKTPSEETIVNPADLPPRERDSVCEQCHLSGEVRVLNPGKDFGDFQPGMALEDVFSVYLHEMPAGEPEAGRFKVVSHVEQLAASRCKQASGEAMWCGTCHDPHETPTEAAAYYRKRCERCHEPGKLAERHEAPLEDCAGCHMPKKQAYDSGHSAFTDHRIARRPSAASPPGGLWRLRAWRPPQGPLAERNLGLAYAFLAEQERSGRQAAEAFRNLVPAMRAFPETDLPIPHALGRLMLARGRTDLALELFQHVVSVEPDNPQWRQSLADAWHASGDHGRAVAELEKAVDLDPLLESSYRALSMLYVEAKQPGKAAGVWKRYLKAVPDSIFARQAIRKLDAGN